MCNLGVTHAQVSVTITSPATIYQCAVNTIQVHIENTSGSPIEFNAIQLSINESTVMTVPPITNQSLPLSITTVSNNSSATISFDIILSCDFPSVQSGATFECVFGNLLLITATGSSTTTIASYPQGNSILYTPQRLYFNEVNPQSSLKVNAIDFDSPCAFGNNVMGVGRVLEYKNLSTSLSYNGTIELNDALSCTKYGFNYCEWQVGTTITQVPLNSPVDVLNFQINLSTIPGNVSIGPNASLFIRECIIKDDPLENYCPSDENSGCKISTQFSYECSGTCDQTTRVTSMERGDKRPFISIERVNPANNTSCNPDCVWWDPSTASTLTDWEFVIRNSGDDLARDIELGLSNPFPNSLFILPSFNIAEET